MYHWYCYNTDEPQKYYAKLKKPESIIYDSTYMKYPEKVNSESLWLPKAEAGAGSWDYL